MTKKIEKIGLLLSVALILSGLIQIAVGSCQLRVTVRKTVRENQGEVHETQLQLQCDNGNCPTTNFITCDTYSDLNISTDCSGDHCSKLFNLYEDLNLTSSQAASVNACPTYTPATMTVTTVVPNSTAFTTTQSSYITTSIVLSITTMWTPSPQSTVTELVTITVTKAPSQIESCKPIDPTTITIPSLCEFKQPQSITLLNSSQTLGADSFSKPGVPTQEPASVLGALLGICMVLLAFVTVGWVWTCWTTSRKKKTGNISQNISNTDLTTINTPDINLDNNPAYETQSSLQRNLAYEDTTLQSDKPRGPSIKDPTYEIIPPAASVNSITLQILRSSEGGEEYDRLNRGLSNTH